MFQTWSCYRCASCGSAGGLCCRDEGAVMFLSDISPLVRQLLLTARDAGWVPLRERGACADTLRAETAQRKEALYPQVSRVFAGEDVLI